MQMSRFTVARFGAVNVIPDKKMFRQTVIRPYGLEFYTQDWTGGSIIDGVFRRARRYYYYLAKPGQRQQLVAPYRCHFINFVTTDQELSNLEPTYLQKLYTAAYGRTPAQRTLDMRITAARMALQESDSSIGEIAQRLGFSSQAYFTSVFKQAVRCTPTQFRARQRKREDG